MEEKLFSLNSEQRKKIGLDIVKILNIINTIKVSSDFYEVRIQFTKAYGRAIICESALLEPAFNLINAFNNELHTWNLLLGELGYSDKLKRVKL